MEDENLILRVVNFEDPSERSLSIHERYYENLRAFDKLYAQRLMKADKQARYKQAKINIANLNMQYNKVSKPISNQDDNMKNKKGDIVEQWQSAPAHVVIKDSTRCFGKSKSTKQIYKPKSKLCRHYNDNIENIGSTGRYENKTQKVKHEKKFINFDNLKALLSHHRSLCSAGVSHNELSRLKKRRRNTKPKYLKDHKMQEKIDNNVNILFTRRNSGQNELISQCTSINKEVLHPKSCKSVVNSYIQKDYQRNLENNMIRSPRPIIKTSRKKTHLRLRNKNYTQTWSQGNIAKVFGPKKEGSASERTLSEIDNRRDVEVYQAQEGGFGDIAIGSNVTTKKCADLTAIVENGVLCSTKPKVLHDKLSSSNSSNNFIKYILLVCIIVAWFPCIIAYLLLWLITFPLRPHFKKWKVKRNTSHDKRPENNHEFRPSLKKLITRVELFHKKLYKTATSLLRSNENCICLEKKPHRNKQYHLRYSSHRGWVLIPKIVSRRQINPEHKETISEHLYWEHNNVRHVVEGRISDNRETYLGEANSPVERSCDVLTCLIRPSFPRNKISISAKSRNEVISSHLPTIPERPSRKSRSEHDSFPGSKSRPCGTCLASCSSLACIAKLSGKILKLDTGHSCIERCGPVIKSAKLRDIKNAEKRRKEAEERKRASKQNNSIKNPDGSRRGSKRNSNIQNSNKTKRGSKSKKADDIKNYGKSGRGSKSKQSGKKDSSQKSTDRTGDPGENQSMKDIENIYRSGSLAELKSKEVEEGKTFADGNEDTDKKGNKIKGISDKDDSKTFHNTSKDKKSKSVEKGKGKSGFDENLGKIDDGVSGKIRHYWNRLKSKANRCWGTEESNFVCEVYGLKKENACCKFLSGLSEFYHYFKDWYSTVASFFVSCLVCIIWCPAYLCFYTIYKLCTSCYFL